MTLFGKGVLNLTGSKSYLLFNGTEKYFKKLRAAYLDVKNKKENDYLYFSFFTLCSATLEYSLNYILADYCVQKFGPEDYKQYLQEYISFRFKNKLLMTPHIVSEGSLKMNEDSFAFKKLCEMINKRNKILHNKEFLTEVEIPMNLSSIDDEIIVPKGKETVEFTFSPKKNVLEELNRKACLDYAKAMSDFKEFIMNPFLEGQMDVNKLILKGK